MTDPILSLAREHLAVDNQPLVDFAVKYTGILAKTRQDDIVRAVGDEIRDLVRRARAAVEALGPEVAASPDGRAALDALREEGAFPRDRLDELAARARAGGTDAALAAELEAWCARHRALEARMRWLLRGTPPQERSQLDPFKDADRLHHGLASAFRFEARVLEMLAINRIAQSPTIGNFFRSTKEAETNAVMRFYDTYALYGNVFEWGVDSFRGGAALRRMNEIHGRYYIPNDEMKFVLLQGAFTWLDGADRIGHRPITELERRGMLVSWVRMGRAMNIQDLSEDYGESYAWYRAVCEATATFEPYKRSAFDAIVSASVSGQLPPLRDGLFLAARVAMDETYRSATGYPEPTREEKQAVRAVFFTVGSLVEQIPYSPFLRSLQNTPARKGWTDPKELGTPDRSRFMPAAVQERPNRGFPEWQVPVRSVGEAESMDLPEIDWKVVQSKAAEGLLWCVVDGFVYDVTVMRDVHPGGAAILERWAGRDATKAFHGAKHTPGSLVFSLNYRIGRVVGEPPPRRLVARADAGDLAEAAEAVEGPL